MIDKLVYTTRFVINDLSPILQVVHDIDDDWQFFSAEGFISESDAKIVALREIIAIDNSITEILDMPCSMRASRQSVKEEWTFSRDGD